MDKLISLTNEHQRIAALKSYNILDTQPEKDFDDITSVQKKT